MQFDRTVTARGHDFHLTGWVKDSHEHLADAFAENFAVEEEIGASVAVFVDGAQVADLWGGFRDANFTKPWDKDTIVCMMSVSKGISGITFNGLISEGLIDPAEKVATYWPEFAQNGKENITVSMVLDHTCALPVVTEPLYKGAIFDCDLIVSALERQAPLWQPGTTAAYHIHTQGNLLGEIARRVTGKRFRELIQDRVIGPLGGDYRIGGLTDADIENRVATLVPTLAGTLLERKDTEPDSLLAKGFTQHPDEPIGETLNSHGWRTAEIASANGHGTARTVAKVYGAVARGGSIDGVTLMSPQTVADMITEQHHQYEKMQQRHYHQGRGILLNTEEAVWMGPNPRSFGHHGFGGSIGFGDPDARIGFSYACNKMHARGDNGPRARRIIEALYADM